MLSVSEKNVKELLPAIFQSLKVFIFVTEKKATSCFRFQLGQLKQV